MSKLGKFAAACAVVLLGFCAMAAVQVSPGSGDDAAAITAAIAEAAGEGGDGVVQLAGGTYVLTSGITIDKGVTLRGLNAAVTTLKSDGSRFTPVTLNHADAVLERVTVRDGLHDSCGGVRKCTADKGRTNSGAVHLDSADGVVRRCVIDECKGAWGDIGCYQLPNGGLTLILR